MRKRNIKGEMTLASIIFEYFRALYFELIKGNKGLVCDERFAFQFSHIRAYVTNYKTGPDRDILCARWVASN